MEEEFLNEEIIEDNTEDIQEDNQEDIVQSDEFINNVVSDQEITQEENVLIEQKEQSENDLLIEYIKTQLSQDIEEQTEETQENVEISSNSTTSDSSAVDNIGPLKDSIDLLYQEQLNTNMSIEDYLSDNTMQSNVEDISLTNQLLIVVFIGILFTALLNFSRRIF